MNKKILRRAGILAGAAILSLGTLGMFAGCTSNHPEVTVTYDFDGKTYEVEYVLSRTDAPKTVKHFIELADAGYYDYDEETDTGFCIHDYTEEYLLTGGYKLSGGELEEVDYFSILRDLEEKTGKMFTQSVWQTGGTAAHPEKGEALYTLYGEGKLSLEHGSREYRHKKGALVMYYTDKGNFSGQVTVERSDKGKYNDGEPLHYEGYAANSATSQFYTWLSSTNPSERSQYIVFGMAKDYEGQLEDGLLKAISDYIDAHKTDDEYSFTETQENVRLNKYDPFADIRRGDVTATFETPVSEPILIRSVRVTKY